MKEKVKFEEEKRLNQSSVQGGSVRLEESAKAKEESGKKEAEKVVEAP